MSEQIKSVFKFNEYTHEGELKLDEGYSWITNSCRRFHIKHTNIKFKKKHREEYNIDYPLLIEGDEFYLEDIDIVVEINKVLRTSGNYILYTCDDIYKIANDEEYKKLEDERDKKNEELQQLYDDEERKVTETPKRKGFFVRIFGK